MKSKTYLFVDGSNLYAGQYELFGPNKYLDFSKFIENIEKKLRIQFSQIYFYASYSPKMKKPIVKQKLYLKNEALFYRNVRQTQRTTFFKGYRSKISGKEKEVDVKLAVDIVNFAHLNKYDYAYLMSGDADFMHALKIAEELKKKIAIFALQNRLPVRFTYNYQTYLFRLKEIRSALTFTRKQKITVVDFRKENIITKV